ncbi:CsgG/HfaB family protein [Ramlibacter alkalitolerans]|uniref:Curli production assembly/transport component CsgG n=1 Tax=Ramlibacter alkalitolerans TaxID=2039631 RepID=A0ABS1JWG2_9BURK|nr:CsgG/HfaB family protein [Ramlibacter alkalitolerans]MBL0427875.1 hypothetical protein [Ramlibacter alkalitolerans]
MKKTALALAAFAAVALSTAAFAEDTITTQSRDYKLPRCDKPLGTLVVGKLECKADSCQANSAANAHNPVAQLLQMKALAEGGLGNVGAVGDGLGSMLTTALKETGCFDIQERAALDDINKELALVGKKVEAQQADFLVSGAVTSIEGGTETKAIGGGFIPIIGSVGTTKKKVRLSLDIRVIDVNRAKVLDSKTIVADSESSSFGLGVLGGGTAAGGIFGVGGSMSNQKSTSLDAVSREAVASSTIFIANTLFKAKGVTPAAE